MTSTPLNPFKRITPEGRRAIRLASAYRDTFQTPAGHEVLHDLIRRNAVLGSTYQADNDPLGMAFREGQRNAILGIIHQLGLDWDQLRDIIEKEDANEREFVESRATTGG